MPGVTVVAGVLPGVTVAAAVLAQRAGRPPVQRARGRVERPRTTAAAVRQAAARVTGAAPTVRRDLRPRVDKAFVWVVPKPVARLRRAALGPTAVAAVELTERAAPVVLQDVGAGARVPPSFARVGVVLPLRVAPPGGQASALADLNVFLYSACRCGGYAGAYPWHLIFRNASSSARAGKRGHCALFSLHSVGTDCGSKSCGSTPTRLSGFGKYYTRCFSGSCSWCSGSGSG